MPEVNSKVGQLGIGGHKKGCWDVVHAGILIILQSVPYSVRIFMFCLMSFVKTFSRKN